MTEDVQQLLEPLELTQARILALQEAACALTDLYGADTGAPLAALAQALQTRLTPPEQEPQ